MSIPSFLVESPVQLHRLVRGTVVDDQAEGLVPVDCDDGDVGPVECVLLQTSEGPGLQLAPGDAVLVWLPEAEDHPGVILGRIGPARSPAPQPDEPPDELIFEAKQSLTLKCGEGSITLRGDGKILIKGKDLVSRAQRMNRIKGGAVAIN